MGRRYRRIGRNVVVGMPEEVWNVEHEPGVEDQKACRAEGVLDGRMGAPTIKTGSR